MTFSLSGMAEGRAERVLKWVRYLFFSAILRCGGIINIVLQVNDLSRHYFLSLLFYLQKKRQCCKVKKKEIMVKCPGVFGLKASARPPEWTVWENPA